MSILSNFVNTVVSNVVNNVETNIKNVVQDFINPAQFMSNIRKGQLPSGAEFSNSVTSTVATTAPSDWRVRLALPNFPPYSSSPIFQPLRESNQSLVFPTTPSINITHSANYSSLAPLHSNYDFQTYINSSIGDITIESKFPVENEYDGMYWISAVHFLKSVTKMFYGENSSNKGSPPPVVYLHGYGNYIFDNVPVVVKSFSLNLPDNVDYLKVPITNTGNVGYSVGQVDPRLAQAAGLRQTSTGSGYSYVPLLSSLSITVHPTYSRNKVSQFNLDDFVKGNYIGKGNGFL